MMQNFWTPIHLAFLSGTTPLLTTNYRLSVDYLVGLRRSVDKDLLKSMSISGDKFLNYGNEEPIDWPLALPLGERRIFTPRAEGN